jgi:hypothetical protein
MKIIKIVGSFSLFLLNQCVSLHSYLNQVHLQALRLLYHDISNGKKHTLCSVSGTNFEISFVVNNFPEVLDNLKGQTRRI